MKEKVLTLLREMTNDSKSVSYKAERELCIILTEVIDRLDKIEEKVGLCVRVYPDKIENVNVYDWYYELPKEINCNNDNFCFKTEWLDMNLYKYFEELKKEKINIMENKIFHIECDLNEYKKDLDHIREFRFEDL